MKILDALRKRGADHAAAAGKAGSPGVDEPPIPGYDQLGDKQVAARLRQFSQVELAAIETYERSHRNRAEVLDKLRYMRGSEPLPGYDALSPEQITTSLAGADTRTVRAVRDYERKFRHRPEVLEESMRALPNATASAGEERAQEERDARVRRGIAGREKTVRDLPG
jgi:hypothetical protein